MRKHCSDYYKCYDMLNFSERERITRECFNDYGLNLGSNKRREIDYDNLISKYNCRNLKKMNPKK